MKRKIMKNGVIGLLVLAVLFVSAVAAFAANMSANAGCDNLNVTLSGGKVKNSDNATSLAVGYVLQYIYAGPDNTIQPPNASGNPTGDDVLITSKTVGSDTVYATFSGQAGMFYHAFTGSYASGTPQVYVRAWNASSIASATYYGNSALFTPTLNSPPSPNSVDYGIANFYTNVPFNASSIASVTPASGLQGASITGVAIVGTSTHFSGSTTVSFGSNITVSNVSASNATHLTCDIVIGGTAVAGARNVVVTTGSEIATGTNAFTVTGPAFSSVTPSSGNQGATLNGVAIVGTLTHFSGSTTVNLGSDISVSNIAVSDATHLTCDIAIGATAVTGARNVVITTGGEVITGTNAFTVNTPGTNVGGGGKIYEKAGGIMMAYPNPFNPNDAANPLKMLFNAATGEAVDIYIFDTNARIIYQSKDNQLAADRIVLWDGDTSYGETVENGLYLIRIVKDGKLVAKGKILVIKK